MLWKEQVNSVVVVTVLYHSNRTETQRVQKCHRDGGGGVLTHAQRSEVQCVKGDPQGLCTGVGRSQATGG